jgi:hypothetical protein
MDPQIEHLQDRVAEKHGFLLVSHSHQMRGVCRQCRPRERAAGRTVSGEGARTGPVSLRRVPQD